MRRHHASILAFGAITLCLLAKAGRAQDAPEPPKPPLFPQLFTHATGTNAYEDWVYAADLIQNNKAADDVLDPDATLAQKRQLLDDRTVQQALLILHNSFGKPTLPPGNGTVEHQQYLQYAGLRKLARLLYTQIYVCFADGRIDGAMQALEEGLRFGYAMQKGSLISGLCGCAVHAIVLKSFGLHLDQLSEYQCSRLQRIAEEWQDVPSPLIAILAGDKQETLESLAAQRNDVNSLEQMLDQTYPADEDPPLEVQKLLQYLRTQPGAVAPAMDQVKAMAAARYDNVIANLKSPFKERKAVPEITGNSLVSLLFNQLTPSLKNTTDRYDRIQATIRLLGVHAAIRRYRWEHNHLPDSLADLHLGALNTDPFTGKGFLYLKKSETYDLSSFGPISYDARGQAISVPTRPVRL